ncbi:hypothetical protein AMECASPLE_010030 [Ameca splendens]|uniref:Uncharacterized protein n=1 Tax=Ameca splendens TaxID=208324 RepID=A0ABV1A758_9TELE
MQTPCRKTPSRESNPGPSCCKATVPPTVPPCSLQSIYCKIVIVETLGGNPSFPFHTTIKHYALLLFYIKKAIKDSDVCNSVIKMSKLKMFAYFCTVLHNKDKY